MSALKKYLQCALASRLSSKLYAIHNETSCTVGRVFLPIVLIPHIPSAVLLLYKTIPDNCTDHPMASKRKAMVIEYKLSSKQGRPSRYRMP